ncbi:MAG: glutamine amidotransferase [Methylobacter sp.]
MKPLIIVKTGSTFPSIRQRAGDFEDWIIREIGPTDVGITVVNAMQGEALPPVDSPSGVIVTGSPAMVTDKDDWMRVLADWIAQVVERNIPLLGICFGHQLLADAMNGRVDYHPDGREIGTVAIRLTAEGKQDKLLGALSDTFLAHTTHAQTVIELPANALRLAENAFEINHAFRLGENAWGVQFHPEFSSDVMRAYVSEQSDALLKQGYDVEALIAAVADTDAANALLKRFMTIVRERA